MQIVLRNINTRVFQQLLLILKMPMLSIMYMAKNFMLHVSLNWSEYGVDDLALWPFAVKHATWLTIGSIAEKQDLLQLNFSPRLMLIIENLSRLMSGGILP